MVYFTSFAHQVLIALNPHMTKAPTKTPSPTAIKKRKDKKGGHHYWPHSVHIKPPP
jgi:hypothetical protein